MGVLAPAIIVLVIGILACADHVRETGREDPPECVIDELAGQWLACAFAPDLWRVAAGHAPLPARFFPGLRAVPPVRHLEALAGELGRRKSARAALGVMTDDMVAGLMAGVLVVAARYFFHL